MMKNMKIKIKRDIKENPTNKNKEKYKYEK